MAPFATDTLDAEHSVSTRRVRDAQALLTLIPLVGSRAKQLCDPSTISGGTGLASPGRTIRPSSRKQQ
jgi:hypothetical protein